MANYTENYNLTKPSTGDHFNIETINDNFDIIDTQLTLSAENTESILEILKSDETKVYSPSNNIQETVDTFSGSGNNSRKLTYFTAKYDGTILLRIKYSIDNNTNTCGITCYNCPSVAFVNAAEGSITTDFDNSKGTSIYSFVINKNLSEDAFLMPVQQGHSYYVESFFSGTYSMNSFEICYDVIPVEEVDEFAAA